MTLFVSTEPIYLQLIDILKQKIALGEMLPGDKLPSSRELAVQYQINPNTANRVYKEMEMMDLCYTKRGMGTFVIDDDNISARLRNELAKKYISAFLKNMTNLGYDKEKIINDIKEGMNDGTN